MKQLALLISSVLLVALFGEVVCRLLEYGPLKQYRYSETKLFEYAPSQRAYTNLHSKPIYINAHSIREDDIPLRKPEGIYRILIIGDSTTFGFGIELKHTYATAACCW